MNIRKIFNPTTQDVKINDQVTNESIIVLESQKLDLELEYDKIKAKLISAFAAARREVDNHQTKMYLVEFFQELSHSMSEEVSKFVQDLGNNNSQGVENEKLIRRQIREKGYQMIKSLEETYDKGDQEYRFLTEKIRTWNLHRNKINIDISYRKKIYEDIKLAQRDIVGIDGKEMKELCQRIEELSHKFIKIPKGPIGACVSVHVEWCPIVKYILKPFAFTYLVDSQEDGKILQELIDRIFGEIVPIWPTNYSLRPSVWITKFNIPKFKVSKCKGNVSGSKILTVMDTIQIDGDDDVVLKFLVEYIKMERILLFKTQHDAFSILSDPVFLPKRCLLAYTLDFYKVYPHPSFRSIRVAEDDDISIATTDYPNPNYMKHTYPSPSLMELNLIELQTARDEMEGLLRSLKDIQLMKLKVKLELREELDRLQKGFQLLKDVKWNKIEDAVKHVIFLGMDAKPNMLQVLEADRAILHLLKIKVDEINAADPHLLLVTKT